MNNFVHKLPKATKYPNLVFKRGLTDLDELWQWHQNVVAGQILRQNGSVILLDNFRIEKRRWNFAAAYPVKWVGPELKADGKCIISLSAGEPDFNTPKEIIDSAYKAALEGQTKYAATTGILPLREAIKNKMKKDNNLDYNADEIVSVSTAIKHISKRSDAS